MSWPYAAVVNQKLTTEHSTISSSAKIAFGYLAIFCFGALKQVSQVGLKQPQDFIDKAASLDAFAPLRQLFGKAEQLNLNPLNCS